MLSNENIRKINSQIEDELRDAGRSYKSREDREAALDRVAKLQTLLSPQTTQPVDVDQLADAIIRKLSAPQPPTHPLTTLVDALIARHR